MKPQNLNPKQIELAERKSPAVLTMILIALIIIVSYLYRPAHSEIWIHDHIFQANKILDLIHQNAYTEILQMLFYSNFLTINIWQSIFSAYFLFTFGLAVESRLGPVRFICVTLLGATIPWAVQFWDVLYNPVWPLYFERLKSDTYFFGPAFILCTLASTYMLLIPKKSMRELYVMQSGEMRDTKVLNRSKTRPAVEHFGLSPELFMSGFVLYEIVQRAFMILPWKDLDTMGFYAVIVASLIGWGFGLLVLSGLKESFTDHPLKHEAVRRYHELVDLDVDSENAIKGAARAVGLPDEQVRVWVHENKGRLRTK